MKSIAREITKTTVTEDGNTDGPRKMILITTTFPLFIKKAVPHQCELCEQFEKFRPEETAYTDQRSIA